MGYKDIEHLVKKQGSDEFKISSRELGTTLGGMVGGMVSFGMSIANPTVYDQILNLDFKSGMPIYTAITVAAVPLGAAIGYLLGMMDKIDN